MVSGGPYGIEDILGGAGYLKALAILLLLPLAWSFPTALMIGELASAIPDEGGFYVWVRRALGPFWGYQEAWLSLTASIFDMAIYPTIFVLYLSRLFPAWTAGSRGTLWELALIALCCLWNLRGAPAVGEGSIGLFVVLLAPFVVLVGAALWHGWHLQHTVALWTSTKTGSESLSDRHPRRAVELHGLGQCLHRREGSREPAEQLPSRHAAERVGRSSQLRDSARGHGLRRPRNRTVHHRFLD